MKYSVFTFGVLLILVLVAAVKAKKCPSPSDVCVPAKYCPHVHDASKSNRERHKGRSRACPAAGYGSVPRVCCDASRMAGLGRSCVDSKDQRGKCVAAGHCKPFANYLQHGRWNSFMERDMKNSVCYQKNETKYYCCLEEFIYVPTKKPKYGKNVPTKKPKHGRNDNELSLVENAFTTCLDPKGKSGLCLPVQHCDSIYQSFLNRRIYQDQQLANFVRKSTCQSYVPHAICCARPPTEAGNSFIRHRKVSKLGFDRCGVIQYGDKILQGSEADLGKYPWMANLMYQKWRQVKTFCSGTLIHPRYVLTAAHCMWKSIRPFAVRLGEHNLNYEQDCVDGVCAGPVREYAIKNLIPNENFDGETANYDIALIELHKQVALSEMQIYPICLPLSQNLLMLWPKKLTVSGWGLTEKLEPSSVLLEAELEIVKGPQLCDGESTFCARGTNGAKHCAGDSGGPYQTIVPLDGGYRYVQFGVISGGSSHCSTGGRSGVGVMVGYHINWILNNMDI